MKEKNTSLDDMEKLANCLRSKGFLLFMIGGFSEEIREVERFCDFLCPYDPSLQNAAAMLKLSDVFVGGDSGPAHLAAAVGTPVVSLRPPRQVWINGPFCDPRKLSCVEGTIVEKNGQLEMSFDSEKAASLAIAFLSSKKMQGLPR